MPTTAVICSVVGFLQWMTVAAMVSYILYTVGCAAVWSVEIASTTAGLMMQGLQAIAYLGGICLASKAAFSFAPACALAPLALRIMWTTFSSMPSEALPLALPSLEAAEYWGVAPVACTTITAMIGYVLYK